MKKAETFDDIYSLILGQIISGTLMPGEVITESGLAQRFGQSRTPVREALNRLECEGLIITTNRTKRVVSPGKMDILEIFELKELIEGDVAYKAARNINDRQVKQLEEIIRNMNSLALKKPHNETEEKELLDQWFTLDRQFHGLLFECAGNKRTRQLIATLNLQWHRMKVGLAAMEGRVGYAINEHALIAAAVIKKDPAKARKEMVAHLENLKKVIVRLMSAFGQGGNN